MRIARLLFLATLLVVSVSPAFGEAAFELINADGPGEGLNDPSPFVAIGGNDATTLGEARMRAVEFAMSLWAQALDSTVPIRVSVSFDPLGGTAFAATLGLGGAEDVFRDFSGAPEAATWYSSALADALAGIDLSGGTSADLSLTFNSEVDGDTVLGTAHFYYGLDDAPPVGDISFLAIALHEAAHGLGVETFLDSSGAKLFGYDDAYMRHLDYHGSTPTDFPSMTDSQRVGASTAGTGLHWTGPRAVAEGKLKLSSGNTNKWDHIEMFAPTQFDPLLSIEHFSQSLEPPEVMEPFYLGDIGIDLCLSVAMLEDIGWPTSWECQEGVVIGLVDDSTIIGESGQITVDQSQPDSWTVVALQHTFSDPVVFVNLSTYLDAEPTTLRVRNVTADSFEVRLEEWDYLDGIRSPEDVYFMVLEAGDHLLDDGRRLLVSRHPTDHDWADVDFALPFSATPVVLSQVQTVNDPIPIVTRQRNGDATGFQLRVQEEEAYYKTSAKVHATETVGYLAIDPGSGGTGSQVVEAASTADSVKQNWYSVGFADTHPVIPVLFAGMPKTDGGDTAGVRQRNLTSGGVEVKVEEEASYDAELKHTKEVVNYLLIQVPGLLTIEGGSQ